MKQIRQLALTVLLVWGLLISATSLSAKGNKVPFINPDGSRTPAEKSRAEERADQFRRQNEETHAPAPAPASETGSPVPGDHRNFGIKIIPSSSDDELRFTVTVPQREYEPGEYRPNRPGQWSGRSGKVEFQLTRTRQGGNEQTAITVKCPNRNWKKEWTPLHCMAAAGYEAGIRAELDKGISVDASAGFMTPLHISAVMGEEGAARLLLQNGANITAKTFDGKTPPELASLCRHPELVRLLTAFTAARRLTDGGKTVTVTLGGGQQTDLTAELKRIASGRKDEHHHDGSVFGNYERKLPPQSRYYYTEFVHRTNPRTPGPRRVVVGMKGDVWYTPDHYSTFFRVTP
ncbi:MAG: ankyrin repeat domain-containing protein [Thermoguttaceae bacterium]|nr:ankyrin repeat domain-containing protein [Thermoguttaceae bacterium]